MQYKDKYQETIPPEADSNKQMKTLSKYKTESKSFFILLTKLNTRFPQPLLVQKIVLIYFKAGMCLIPPPSYLGYVSFTKQCFAVQLSVTLNDICFRT